MTQEQYADAFSRGFSQTVGFLCSRGVTPDTAEETAQAGWARGWERRDQLRDPNSVLTWVNSIALNLFRNQLRRRKTCELPLEMPAPAQSSLPAIDLGRVIDKCKPDEREILRKHYVAGFTSGEIAAQYNCKASTVRVRLFRLRRRLQTLTGR